MGDKHIMIDILQKLAINFPRDLADLSRALGVAESSWTLSDDPLLGDVVLEKHHQGTSWTLDARLDGQGTLMLLLLFPSPVFCVDSEELRIHFGDIQLIETSTLDSEVMVEVYELADGLQLRVSRCADGPVNEISLGYISTPTCIFELPDETTVVPS